MTLLILGLILFLATHSLRIAAPDWRQRQIARLGVMPWRGLISLASLAALLLIIWGFRQAGAEPITLYRPPLWLKHLAIALTLPAFLLLAAAFVPGNSLKARFGHPMVLGVKIWAFAHLLANGAAHHLLLFGTLLLWSAVSFASARRQDRRQGLTRQLGEVRRNLFVLIAGLAAWALVALLLHGWVIGVRPFA
jgi:uncharacterized membrane protein